MLGSIDKGTLKKYQLVPLKSEGIDENAVLMRQENGQPKRKFGRKDDAEQTEGSGGPDGDDWVVQMCQVANQRLTSGRPNWTSGIQVDPRANQEMPSGDTVAQARAIQRS